MYTDGRCLCRSIVDRTNRNHEWIPRAFEIIDRVGFTHIETSQEPGYVDIVGGSNNGHLVTRKRFNVSVVAMREAVLKVYVASKFRQYWRLDISHIHAVFSERHQIKTMCLDQRIDLDLHGIVKPARDPMLMSIERLQRTSDGIVGETHVITLVS